MNSLAKEFTPAGLLDFARNETGTQYFPNGLKVSSTQNPMYFPVENTYQVGSAQIVALCSNAIAVGTGQTGAAPLYVFCKDGVYALFVDSTGEMTYTNARIIARDVCNNAKSVTPIDEGVVFTTDRGLMMISGNEVVEIGQPLEGDYADFTNTRSVHYNKIAANAYSNEKLSGLDSMTVTNEEFLRYLKHSIIAYNHNERELMIANIFKKTTASIYNECNYAYVLDRSGNWTRRDITPEEFVNNYPSTYYLSNGRLFQLDGNTDQDNGIFAMSNVIKLDSIGFKSINRFVARGYFDTINVVKTEYERLNLNNGGGTTSAPTTRLLTQPFIMVEKGTVNIILNSFAMHFQGEAPDFSDDENYLELKIVRNGYKIASFIANAHVSGYDVFFDTISENVELPSNGNYSVIMDVVGVVDRGYQYTLTSEEAILEYPVKRHYDRNLGIYVFGSYDGRKFACLGHREKYGNFTDIGCLVERTDCKFFRVVIAGQLTKESRLDYFEVEEKQSILYKKIR